MKKQAPQMIHSTVRMRLLPEKQSEAMKILLSVAERTRAKAGCISCTIYQDAGEDGAILYSAQWRSESEMKHHLREEEYQKVLLVMEMSSKPPEIRFYTISRIQGFEPVEEARAVNNENE